MAGFFLAVNCFSRAASLNAHELTEHTGQPFQSKVARRKAAQNGYLNMQ
jgi:hypothetical protein